jgi:hypothetical protein
MAPEYAFGVHLSIKADVFSFGVLILEIISGTRVQDFSTLVMKNFSIILNM